MALIDILTERLSHHPKRIIFPEGGDPRILQAARQLATRQLAVPILLGDRTEIKDRAARLNLRLEGMRILEPERSDDFENFIPLVQSMPRFSSLGEAEVRQLMRSTNHYGAMMLALGRGDALVGGATSTASNALRPLLQLIPRQTGIKTASSMLLFDMEESKLGLNGVLFLADCGVVPEPDSQQLAEIAVMTAGIARHLTGQIPRVAFLAFSSHSLHPVHSSVERIRTAVRLARDSATGKGIGAEFEGELQVDAALDIDAARQKGFIGDAVAGRANVLIFPDLNSGNIASKLVQQIAGVRAYGQIITGFEKPCAEISRGAHAIDIFGTAIIVGCQAIDPALLYGTDTHSTSATTASA